MNDVIAIERRLELGVEEFRDRYLDAGQPVVIRDAAKNWAAFAKWSPEYLKERCGSRIVPIDGVACEFRSFVDQVLRSVPEDPAPYLIECDMTVQFPELLGEIEPAFAHALPNRFMSKLVPGIRGTKGARRCYPELLIGGRGTRFPVLHYDAFHVHAFITQLYGSKEFTLFAPWETPYLYSIAGMAHISSIDDVDSPDLDRFPLFAKATRRRVTVEAGDTIFVPAGWWHVTRLLSPSLAVSLNSLTRSNWRGYCADYLRTCKPRERRYLAPYLKLVGMCLDLLEKFK
jgi:cupin-like protein